MGYSNGTASVTTTAAVLLTANENDGAVVHNRGPASIFLGGSGVTADQASTGGVEVGSGERQTIPTVGGGGSSLYAITAAGSASVSWLVVG